MQLDKVNSTVTSNSQFKRTANVARFSNALQYGTIC